MPKLTISSYFKGLGLISPCVYPHASANSTPTKWQSYYQLIGKLIPISFIRQKLVIFTCC